MDNPLSLGAVYRSFKHLLPRRLAHALMLLVLLSGLLNATGISHDASAQGTPVVPAGDSASPSPVNTPPASPVGLNIYVTDTAGLLDPTDAAEIRQRLQTLDEAGGPQIAVLVLPGTDRDLSEFAPVIFHQWGIGHGKQNDGVLILANADRIRHQQSGNRIFINTGYAIEGTIPDALAGHILDEQALPAFGQGDFSGGIKQTALTVAGILGGNQDLQAHYARPVHRTPNARDIIVLLVMMALFLFNLRRRGGWFIGGFGGGGGWGDGGGFGGGFGGGDSGGGGAGR